MNGEASAERVAWDVRCARDSVFLAEDILSIDSAYIGSLFRELPLASHALTVPLLE